MKKNKLFVLILLSIGLLNNCFASEPLLEKYIIFTFEDKFKISQHGTKTFYWIVAEDSIKSYDFLLSHLFLKNFSKDNLIDCCNGKEIDPYVVDQHTNYNFDSADYKTLEQLEELVSNRRKKLQTITKKWQSGQQEEITIYATPISGKFCSSNFHQLGQKKYGYKGKVYIPYSSFSYLEEFWKSEKAKFVLDYDYLIVHYSIIPY